MSKRPAEDLRAASEDAGSLSAGSKARFQRNAIKDPETGDLYLGPDQFIDAVAPVDEDYVSYPTLFFSAFGSLNGAVAPLLEMGQSH